MELENLVKKAYLVHICNNTHDFLMGVFDKRQLAVDYVYNYIINCVEYRNCQEPFIHIDTIANMEWYYLYEKRAFDKVAYAGRQIGFNSKLQLVIKWHEMNTEIEYPENK